MLKRGPHDLCRVDVPKLNKSPHSPFWAPHPEGVVLPFRDLPDQDRAVHAGVLDHLARRLQMRLAILKKLALVSIMLLTS